LFQGSIGPGFDLQLLFCEKLLARDKHSGLGAKLEVKISLKTGQHMPFPAIPNFHCLKVIKTAHYDTANKRPNEPDNFSLAGLSN
jgi:hypothetical protein